MKTTRWSATPRRIGLRVIGDEHVSLRVEQVAQKGETQEFTLISEVMLL